MSSFTQNTLFGDFFGDSDRPDAGKVEKAKKEEDKPIGKPMVVAYAGHKIPIQDADLTLEQIRRRLERDFPELSKERTEMVLDEKSGLIIPVVKAARKGETEEESLPGVREVFARVSDMFADLHPVNVLVAKNGTFEVRVNEIGIFSVRIGPGEESAGDCFLEGLQMFLPKIPGAMLLEAVKVFRLFAGENLESAVQFFWDRDKLRYFAYVPVQKRGSFKVEFERRPDLEARHLLVMDVHSHPDMGAFFSPVDNEDEKETRLYAVVGLGSRTPYPEISVRMSCGGKFLTLSPHQVFDCGFIVPHIMGVSAGVLQ